PNAHTRSKPQSRPLTSTASSTRSTCSVNAPCSSSPAPAPAKTSTSPGTPPPALSSPYDHLTKADRKATLPPRAACPGNRSGDCHHGKCNLESIHLCSSARAAHHFSKQLSEVSFTVVDTDRLWRSPYGKRCAP